MIISKQMVNLKLTVLKWSRFGQLVGNITSTATQDVLPA